ncbi:M20/M25/M40 family metallo-hydrolase [Thermocatellispora tengchongensis]|uniref:M20/M25/M40 family metallo-hydrolase n=1 Tax=Thermocatellispora tengchongensis TaxID=1073253 RepID=UPI00363AE240
MHLVALQRIADASGGNRAAGTAGYDRSAEYVAERLRAAGYQVALQRFAFPYFRETGRPTLTSGTEGHLASTVEFSGSGDVRGRALRVAEHGCEPGDYRGFRQGQVALVRRGTCEFSVKTRYAQAAGARAVILVNNEAKVPKATLGKPGVARVPVVGVAQKTGAKLAGDRVRVQVRAESGTRTTYNVIAETPQGRADQVVMLGAHLDSVPVGPGINDNGSGSAALLEVAEKLAAAGQPHNKVRFAWWGAEELGLLGSKHYVSHLGEAARKAIALYLNFDMIASKNYMYGVFDGDDSDRVGAGPGPEGSGAIEKAFRDFYAARGLKSIGADFTGRSDYGPFVEAGIPAGGLFTGAEEPKSKQAAAYFGGAAGVPYDSCYHKACDTIENVSDTALDVNTDAIATVLERYATQTSRPPQP